MDAATASLLVARRTAIILARHSSNKKPSYQYSLCVPSLVTYSQDSFWSVHMHAAIANNGVVAIPMTSSLSISEAILLPA